MSVVNTSILSFTGLYLVSYFRYMTYHRMPQNSTWADSNGTIQHEVEEQLCVNKSKLATMGGSKSKKLNPKDGTMINRVMAQFPAIKASHAHKDCIVKIVGRIGGEKKVAVGPLCGLKCVHFVYSRKEVRKLKITFRIFENYKYERFPRELENKYTEKTKSKELDHRQDFSKFYIEEGGRRVHVLSPLLLATTKYFTTTKHEIERIPFPNNQELEYMQSRQKAFLQKCEEHRQQYRRDKAEFEARKARNPNKSNNNPARYPSYRPLPNEHVEFQSSPWIREEETVLPFN
eukprot:jgi/Bigna1/68353/fgenesh1_pg.6_\